MKGISAVLGSTVLILLVVGSSAALYTVIDETQAQDEEVLGPQLEGDSFQISNCWAKDGDTTSLMVRNQGENEINISRVNIFSEAEEVDFSTDSPIIEPESYSEIHLDGIFERDLLDLTYQGQEKSYICDNLEAPKIDPGFEYDEPLLNTTESVFVSNSSSENTNIQSKKWKLDSEEVGSGDNLEIDLDSGHHNLLLNVSSGTLNEYYEEEIVVNEFFAEITGPEKVSEGDTVTFEGRESQPEDYIQHTWSGGFDAEDCSGELCSIEVPEETEKDSFDIELTVGTGDYEKTDTREIDIEETFVTAEILGPEQSTEGDTVEFEAEIEKSNTDMSHYYWYFDDGEEKDGSDKDTVQHTYDQSGSYTVSLEAETENPELEDETEHNIEVEEPESANAEISHSAPFSVTEGSSFTVTWSGTDSEGESPIEYEWEDYNENDYSGSESTVSTSHVCTGEQEFFSNQLTVTGGDGDENTDFDSGTVQCTDSGNGEVPPPSEPIEPE